MKEVRYFFVPNANVEKELPTEEAIHALRVLRLKEGDEIFLMDGDGCFYQAEVSLATSKKCFYSIKQVLKQEPSHCTNERYGAHGMADRESHRNRLR